MIYCKALCYYQHLRISDYGDHGFAFKWRILWSSSNQYWWNIETQLFHDEEVLLHWIDYVIKWTKFHPQPRPGSGPLNVQWGLDGGWFDRFYQHRCSIRQSGTFPPLESYFHKPLLSQAWKLRRPILYCSASCPRILLGGFSLFFGNSLSMTHYIYDKLHCLYQRDAM